MRRLLMFGAIMIMQGVAIVPAWAQVQSDVGSNATAYGAGYGLYDGRPAGNPSAYAPPADSQGAVHLSGRYGYPPSPPQPYPAQPYPPQPYPAQPSPAQPVPPPATSPDAVCTNGRFFDHMTKTCESP